MMSNGSSRAFTLLRRPITGRRSQWLIPHAQARIRAHTSLLRSPGRDLHPRPSLQRAAFPHTGLAPDTCGRTISTRALPSNRGPVFRFLYRFFAYSGGFILVSGGLVLAFFLYDASTYREDLSFADIPVSEHALEPRRGGPKNLPIANVLVDDDDCPQSRKLKDKPKLVILGSGWGSVALLKTLNPDDYHVTVVSPVNYFLFTPMLPSATVGTLELRSLVEPVRRIVQRARGHFLKAEAVDVELSERLLEVAQTDASGEKIHFYLPYDKLVLGVGELVHVAPAIPEPCWLTSSQARRRTPTASKASRTATSSRTSRTPGGSGTPSSKTWRTPACRPRRTRSGGACCPSSSAAAAPPGSNSPPSSSTC